MLKADVPRAEPSWDAVSRDAAAGLARLGHDLLTSAELPRTGGNVVVSSASLGAAFAMARLGARGRTADEIDAVLHFPTSGLGPSYNALTRAWDEAGCGDGRGVPQLDVANAVWAQQGLPFEPGFLDDLARHFGAGVRDVDFTQLAAEEAINRWVREQTHDRIDRLFDGLDRATRMVLANAVYLRAPWAEPFEAEHTHPADFTIGTGDTVRVDTMRRTGEMPYAEAGGWQAVRLAYRGGALSMWVLVPRDAHDPVDLLDPDVLQAARAGEVGAMVRLTLPRWDFRSDHDLFPALSGLGLMTPFGPEADFGAMSSAGLSIDQVVQRADVTVDEEGTEAAAVTGMAFAVSARVPPRDAEIVTADHPFAFAIVHDATTSVLFEGVVGDPRATRV